MIWPVWAVFVLVGSGWAYVAFVQKEATVWAMLMTIGFFGVAGFGSLGIEQTDGTGGMIVSTEVAAAIMCFVIVSGAALALIAALTGQFKDDTDRPDAGLTDSLNR